MNSQSSGTAARRSPYAPNAYRQVRLSYTEEASGALNVSIYVKPLGKAWNESQCLYRFSVPGGGRADSLEGVALRLIQILEDSFPKVSR